MAIRPPASRKRWWSATKAAVSSRCFRPRNCRSPIATERRARLIRRHELARVNVLRPEPQANQARRQTLEVGTTPEHAHGQGRPRRAAARQHTTEKIVLDLNLQPLC